jgi:histidinol-phosphate/aromatic aminotransferase/cobyric acid decarboxylase-like protein
LPGIASAVAVLAMNFRWDYLSSRRRRQVKMRPKFYLFARLESHTNFVFRRSLKITLLYVLLQAQPIIGKPCETMT